MTGRHGSHTGNLDRRGRRGFAGELRRHVPYDAEKGDPSVAITIVSVALVFVEGYDGCAAHVLRDVSFLPASAEQYLQGLEQSRFTTLQDLSWDAVTSWRLSAGEAVDGFAELLLCRWGVELLHHRQIRDGSKSGISDDVLRGIQLQVMLYPALKLLGLVHDYLSCLRLEGGGLAGGWACRFLDALIHPSRVPGLNTAAEVQPVGVGAVVGGLLGRFPGSLEVGERGRAWCGLVGQQRFPLCPSHRLHLFPMGFEPISVLACLLPVSSDGRAVDCVPEVGPLGFSGIVFRRLPSEGLVETVQKVLRLGGVCGAARVDSWPALLLAVM